MKKIPYYDNAFHYILIVGIDFTLQNKPVFL